MADSMLSPPRRSGRLAAKSRHQASNPVVQAQKVIMTKWGIREQLQQHLSDDNAEFDEYMAFFGGPLSTSKREAIRTLFPAGSAINNVQWVEGVDLEV